MSITPARKRLRIALALAAAGVAALLLGIGAVWRDASLTERPGISGPVLPDWREQAALASRIEIVARDVQFSLLRTDQGWVMPSRGGYPVRPDRIAELDAALSGLRFSAAAGMPDLTSTELYESNGREMLLFALYLYQHLPHYVSKVSDLPRTSPCPDLP